MSASLINSCFTFHCIYVTVVYWLVFENINSKSYWFGGLTYFHRRPILGSGHMQKIRYWNWDPAQGNDSSGGHSFYLSKIELGQIATEHWAGKFLWVTVNLSHQTFWLTETKISHTTHVMGWHTRLCCGLHNITVFFVIHQCFVHSSVKINIQYNNTRVDL